MAMSDMVTEDYRAAILEDLPEIEWIEDVSIREAAVRAWSIALSKSSFKRIRDIPGEANPGIMILNRGGQDTHLRGVTVLALASLEYFIKTFPEVDIDRDIVIAGGLCHDVGKAWECDPENQRRWSADGSRVGRPSLRHPIYGAHVCLLAGLPEAVAHIAGCHSPEGDNVKRSLECIIVHEADVAWWTIATASGLIRADTVPDRFTKMFDPRAVRSVPFAGGGRRGGTHTARPLGHR
jgi:23S rRNA maturation-related 3'-5' exoribonuclease YhaM